MKYGQEEQSDKSKSNKDEAFFIEELFSDIIKILLQSSDIHLTQQQSRDRGSFGAGSAASLSYTEKMDIIAREIKGRIGIITPYKS